MDYSHWLKTQFIAQPDKAKADLARMLGLEPPAISKILNGSRQIKAQEYITMRQFFGLPVDGEKAARADNGAYVLEALQPEGALFDGAQATTGPSQWQIPADILSQRTQAPPDKIRIFKIEEPLMEPDFCRDEHVLVDLSDLAPSPAGAFVVSDGFSYMVRNCEIIAGSNPVDVKITTLKKSFQPQILRLDDFQIIGRVMAKLQWI